MNDRTRILPRLIASALILIGLLAVVLSEWLAANLRFLY